MILTNKMVNSIFDAYKEFGSELFKVEFHVTHAALYTLRNEAHHSNTVLFYTRTDIDKVCCELCGKRYTQYKVKVSV